MYWSDNVREYSCAKYHATIISWTTRYFSILVVEAHFELNSFWDEKYLS